MKFRITPVVHVLLDWMFVLQAVYKYGWNRVYVAMIFYTRFKLSNISQPPDRTVLLDILEFIKIVATENNIRLCLYVLQWQFTRRQMESLERYASLSWTPNIHRGDTTEFYIDEAASYLYEMSIVHNIMKQIDVSEHRKRFKCVLDVDNIEKQVYIILMLTTLQRYKTSQTARGK